MALKDAGKFILGALAVLAIGQAARVVPRPTGSEVTDDRIISRSLESSSEIEPHIAATLQGDVAVAWMAVRGGKGGDVATHIGARVSHDRGATWDPIVDHFSPNGTLAADPTVAFFRGAPRVTWLAPGAAVYTAVIGEEPVRVNPASDPAGATYDKPFSASAGDRLHVTYRMEAAKKASIVLASSDNGRAFSTMNIAEGGELPTVCAAGRNVLVVWVDDKLGVMVAASQDLGKTFTRFAASGANEHVATEAPSCVVDGDDVWIGYGAMDAVTPDVEANSPLMDYVVVVRSRDGGKTTFDRSTVRPGAKLMHPLLALRASGGLDVVYLTGGVDGDRAGRVAAHRVVANGAARSPRSIREPMIFASAHGDPAWTGDYFGVASSHAVTLAAIVDTALEVSDAGGSGVERHIVIAPVPEE